MGYINAQKKSKTRDKAHLNWMGGASYDLSDPLVALKLAASSCFFGEPMYYHKDAADKRAKRRDTNHGSSLSAGEVKYLRDMLGAVDPQEWRNVTPAELMESTIDKALDKDPEATLQFAVELRNDLHIRTAPQVILVRAAHHDKVRGTGLVRQYAKELVKRADEPSVGLAYQIARYGRKAIPNALKRAWKDALESFGDYALAKYRMEGRQVSTRDVAHLVHPAAPKDSALYQLRGGELKLDNQNQTWESLVSKKGSTGEVWKEALQKMGYMALLRNLRNLLQNKVDPQFFVDRLVAGAKGGQQLPFRYWSAYQAVASNSGAPPSVLDAIEECLVESLGNLPKFEGRVMSLCDNSGSAKGTMTSSMGSVHVNQIANLTGVLAGMVADEGYIGVFGDGLRSIPVRKKSSVFDQVHAANKFGDHDRGGTEHGIWKFWDQAIKKAEHWDHVFIMSDMQAGHGGLYGDGTSYADYIWPSKGGYGYSSRHIDVPKLISEYRTKVNPKVMVYLVQMAGYQDILVPEFYERTYILGGWSENLLRFAAEMTKFSNGQ